MRFEEYERLQMRAAKAKLGQDWFGWVQPSPWRIDPKTGKAMIPVRVAPVAEPVGGTPGAVPAAALPPRPATLTTPPAAAAAPALTMPPMTRTAAAAAPTGSMFSWVKPSAPSEPRGTPAMFAWAKPTMASATAPTMYGNGNIKAINFLFPLAVITLGAFFVSELSGWTNFLGTRKG